MANPDSSGFPSIEVSYTGLSLSIQVPIDEKGGPRTVRDVVRDAALAVPRAILRRMRPNATTVPQTKRFDILGSVSGVIRPGRLTLLIGHPGSGKSSFLRALTGRLHRPDLLQGAVRYNGLTATELRARGVHLGQLVSYVPQLDEHSPFLTVRETLAFVARNALAGADAAAVDARVAEMLSLLRLQDCAETVVGNALLRGISGGELKRVTIGEGLLSNARFLALDEISTGLDATVTLQIVRALQERCRSGVGVVVALLQATPEAVALFDDVILLREGSVVYHGPLPDLPPYLRELGFFPPDLEHHRATGAADMAGPSSCSSSASPGAHAKEAVSHVRPAETQTEPQSSGTPALAAASNSVPSGVELSNMATDAEAAAAAGEGEEEEDEDLADWAADWVTFPAKRHQKDLLLLEHRTQLHVAVGEEEGSAAVGSKAPERPFSEFPPTTTATLVAAWQSNPRSAALLRSGTSESAHHRTGIELASPGARAQFGVPHVHSAAWHLWLLFSRQMLLNRRNTMFIAFRLGNAIVMGLLVSAMYYQESIADGLNLYGMKRARAGVHIGLFLNTIMFLSFVSALANMSEMSPTMELKKIAYRQVDNGNYPGWAFALALFFAQIPVAAAEAVVFTMWLYFMPGLTVEAGRYFFFVFVAFLSDVFAATLFRCFTYAFPTLEASQTGPMPIIAILVVFAGFLVLPSKMGWMLFIYYIDPYAYAVKSLAQNEFSAARYGRVLPTGGTLGESYLQVFDMPTDLSYKWGGVGFLLGMIAILLAVNVIVFSRVRTNTNIGSARHLEDDNGERAAKEDKQQSGHLPPAEEGASSTHVTVNMKQLSTVPSKRSSVPPDGHGDADLHSIAVHHATSAAASSSLPFAPASVAFRDISYTVKLKNGMTKTLLHRVSGYALPGRMLALMGASGAGKTTLLDVLAGRKNSGVMGGAMFLAGRPKDAATFNRTVAYCEQQDMHAALTTVQEALEFSARLRLPAAVPSEQRAAFVSEVLRLLELAPLAQRLVGVPGAPDALAPGERKRLTIAVELCANTPVLFLDEPTSGKPEADKQLGGLVGCVEQQDAGDIRRYPHLSQAAGLDARAAAVVVRTLRNVASTGRTIICTVHQPSHEIFAQFDDLLLLQRGGWQVYSGRLGHGSGALVRYLQALPGVAPLPPDQNPATWMLDVLAASHAAGETPMGGPAALSPPPQPSASATGGPAAPPPGSATPSLSPAAAGPPAVAGASPPAAATVDDIARQRTSRKKRRAGGAALGGAELQEYYYASQTWTGQCDPALARASVPSQSASGTGNTAATAAALPSVFVQFAMLAFRELNMARRNIPFNVGRIVSLGGLNLLFGTIYSGIAGKATDVAGLQSLVAGIYMVSVFAAMINLNLMLPGQVKIRPVFYRETASLLYSPWVYAVAVLPAELPWLAVAIVIGPTFSYFMMGLSADASVFWTHYLAVYIMTLGYGLLAMAAANALPTFELAQALVSSLAAVLMLYGGIFSKVSSMPPGSAWINTIDPVGYLLRAVLPLHIHCDAGAAAAGTCTRIAYPTPAGVVSWDLDTLMSTLYEVHFADVWVNIGWLALFVPAFFALNAAALRFVRHIVR